MDVKGKIKEESDDTKTTTQTTTTKDAQEPTTATTTKTATEDEIKEEKSDPLLNMFYSEIDEIKKEDFKTNSKEQLDRLLRPGSTYFNLNPFEVLQVDPYTSVDEIKKKYRKLSMYVHPDKNPNDKERAQVAFEALNRAYKLLDDEKQRKMCLEVVDEAREKVDQMCEEKRKKARKELQQRLNEEKKVKTVDLEAKTTTPAAAAATGDKNSVTIDEDDPDKYRHAVYVMTCKLFADIERLKVKDAEKQAEEKKRKAEEKACDEVNNKVKKVWDKNYEETREGRVSSWKDFVHNKGSTAQGIKSLKLPKHKPEKR